MKSRGRVQLLLGIFATAGLVLVSAGPAFADHTPDGRIRRSGESSYVGNDVFNLTGAGQTKAAVKKPGKTAKFEVKFQADFGDGGVVGVFGDAGDGDFTVQYFVEGVDRTSEVTGGGFDFGELALNQTTPKILIKVKVLSDTVNGASFDGLLSGRDFEQPGPFDPDDSVRFVVFAD